MRSDSLQNYRITHMLWHQGELDFIQKTSAEQYQQRFTAMLETLRQRGMNALSTFPSPHNADESTVAGR